MIQSGIAAGLVMALAWFGGMPVRAEDDPGKAVLTQVGVGVIYATNGDPAAAGEKAKPLGKDLEKRLRKEERLRFKEYRALGEDVQPLFRSYENWAQPLKPSDEILVRFEARSKPTRQSTSLDLELWLGRKKILRSDVTLEGGRPLYVLGPEWRGGRMIIAVSLAEPRQAQ
jgi:hypothetical protein